ncbi:hypothetical protein P7C70_g387, partial [Phenoliferia sp. Uapishka_3]
MNGFIETTQVIQQNLSGSLGYLPLSSRSPSEDDLRIGALPAYTESKKSSTAVWLSGMSLAVALAALALSVQPFAHKSLSAYPIFQAFNISSSYSDSSIPRPVTSSQTVVGPRSFGPHYTGCSSSQLLSAIRKIRVDEEGLSKMVPNNRSFEIEDFDYSFDWPDACPRPHVFTSAEACDLLGAFGGLNLNGDSLTRHLTNAIFLILTNKPGGAVWEMGDTCQGDHLFDDGKECRHRIVDNSHHEKVSEPVCGGDVRVFSNDLACPVDPGGYIPRFLDWGSTISPLKKPLSTIVLNSWGLHCHFSPWIPLLGAIKPLFAFAQTSYPRPISLWMSIHAPGSNKPVEYLATQGANNVQEYNKYMDSAIDTMQGGATLRQGGVGFLDWYGMTSGATSFDGTHYMWQINMEKAQLLMNVLDVMWAEAVEDGGLWNLKSLCPPGQYSYQCHPFYFFTKKLGSSLL